MVYEIRLNKIKRWLKRHKFDGILISSPENRRYLSGYTPQDVSITESAGFLLITPSEAFILTDPRYQEEAQNLSLFEPVIYRKGLARALSSLAERLKIKVLLYEENYLSCGRLKALKKALPKVEFSGVSGVIEKWREVKDQEEMRLLEKARELALKIFRILSKEIQPGRTEKEIAWRITELSHRLGEGPSFPPIVASGPNAARPHAEPEDKPLRSGEVVIVDLGVKYRGYCSDLTRTFFLGRVPERLREAHHLVKEAQRLAQPYMKPGLKIREADRKVRAFFQKAGVLQNYLHSLGHGLGLAVHEAPAVSFRSRRRFKVGQVVTLEPGLYFPGLGGVREEEMVFIR